MQFALPYNVHDAWFCLYHEVQQKAFQMLHGDLQQIV